MTSEYEPDIKMTSCSVYLKCEWLATDFPLIHWIEKFVRTPVLPKNSFDVMQYKHYLWYSFALYLVMGRNIFEYREMLPIYQA